MVVEHQSELVDGLAYSRWNERLKSTEAAEYGIQ